MNIYNDRTDITKMIISEDLYKRFKLDYQKVKDDNIDDDYIYTFFAFGTIEGRFDLYIDFGEELQLRKKSNLYSLSNNEIENIAEQYYNHNYCFSNVIFHTNKNTSLEDSYNTYLSKYNFYNSKIALLTVIISEGENDNPKIELFEHVTNHRECYRRKNIYIRVSEDKDISIEKYIEMEKQNNKVNS